MRDGVIVAGIAADDPGAMAAAYDRYGPAHPDADQWDAGLSRAPAARSRRRERRCSRGKMLTLRVARNTQRA
ncbi:MAG TPA: hypothetical protein VF933_25520 [Streptosporangiaceae bacterium]